MGLNNMANQDESLTELLQELDKNKFVKSIAEKWQEQSKTNAKLTLILVAALLVTMLVLNWWGKLSMESNGWLLAALIGYLFGRSQK